MCIRHMRRLILYNKLLELVGTISQLDWDYKCFIFQSVELTTLVDKEDSGCFASPDQMSKKANLISRKNDFKVIKMQKA